MKKFLLALCIAASAMAAQAQGMGGLEGIIVERLYRTDAADAASSVDNGGGTLPVDAVTYRVYVDMLPGFRLNQVAGYPGAQFMSISTTTQFYNNEDRGDVVPGFSRSVMDDATMAMLDSYLSFGAACAGNAGVLKSEDNGVNNIAFNAAVYNNTTGYDMPSVRVQDGIITASVVQPGFIGISPAELEVFNNTTNSGTFYEDNGAYYVLGGVVGATSSNRVLIGQFTTDGEFSFQLNIQVQPVGGPAGTETNYFAVPIGNQVTHPSLIYPAPPVPGCTNALACNYNPAATQDNGTCIVPVPGCSQCNADSTGLVIVDVNGNGVPDCNDVNGCMSVSACNYNPAATVDNGTCIFPVAGCSTCSGGALVIVDTDNDGLCDAADTISGCKIVGACNYVAGATVNADNATCIVPDQCNECNATNDGLVFIDANNNGICDALESSYEIISDVASCVEDDICMPIAALPHYTMTDIIGFDVVMYYDTANVQPTGVVTVDAGRINPGFTDYKMSVDRSRARIDLAVYLNALAPATADWNGTGNVFCVEFAKTSGFAYEDQAWFRVDTLIESYRDANELKVVTSGTFRTVKDSILTGKLKFWNNNIPIAYDVENPGDYLISRIFGSDSNCTYTSDAAVNVTPDLAGNFYYNNGNGPAIQIRRDIAASTNVMPVINGYDAYLTTLVVLNNAWVPNKYQIIAMDVNMDGAVTAGDVSQINQRTVRIIDEFRQAWNYDATGNQLPGYHESKDWLFQDQLTIDTAVVFTASNNWPNAGTNGGFHKFNVPQVPHCLVLPGDNGCEINDEIYKGILLGDVDGNYKNIAPDGRLKSAAVAPEVMLNLGAAQIEAGVVSVPVTFNAADVKSLDLNLSINEGKLAFKGVAEPADYLTAAIANFTQDNREVLFTSFATESYEAGSTVAMLQFDINSDEITTLDVTSAVAYVNGNPAVVKVSDQVNGLRTVSAGINVYPNPANSVLYVEVAEASKVQLLDMSGKMVILEKAAAAGAKLDLNVEGLASGIYTLKVSSNNNVVVEKVTIKK